MTRPLASATALLLSGGLWLTLSGCSTPPEAPEASSAAAPATPAEASDRGETLTGSRLPRKSSDRLLKQIGAAGAKEMERERPPNPGPRVN